VGEASSFMGLGYIGGRGALVGQVRRPGDSDGVFEYVTRQT
jgi:hypothetical protein